MRRVFVIVCSIAAVAAAFLASGAGEESGRKFTVEFDNAFGLVVGGDLKIAGTRAGKVTGMRVDRRTKRALVDFEITRSGFGSLRRDVTCESRPQSLIGEYFVDCDPGTAREELPPGSVIGVERTASTVPADLVNNIMRRPQRERLRIILNEIGAGVGARAEELNAAVRRASPALRETNRVLGILARQNRVLRDLVENADTVLAGLSGNRRDVVRWVREARETAAASAERRDDIAASLQRLPSLLRELRPTMAELGRAADAQAPSLADLNASAGQLEQLLNNLGPFAESTRVNLRSLGKAAEQGRPAVRAGRPVVSQLREFSVKTPELANNLAIVLKDLDDRERAVEADPRSPEGKGYTGFEALLQYVYNQSLAINIYDANGYMLKVNAFVGECSEYQNKETFREKMADDPEFAKRCGSYLGPNQQGLFQPDPTETQSQARPRRTRDRDGAKRRRPRSERRQEAPRDERGGDAKPQDDPAPEPPIDLGETLENLLDGKLPPAPALPGLDSLKKPGLGLGAQQRPVEQDALLDFLFGS